MIKASDLFTTMVSGTIEPMPTVPMSCSMESRAVSPSLRSDTKTTDMNVLIHLRDRWEEVQRNNVPYFWKQRLIVEASTSHRILSITFIPKDPRQSSLLFMQKGEGGAVGFVAPYLSSQDQQKWQAKPEFPACDLICNEETLLQTIQRFDEELRKQLETCLKYFLNDNTSTVLGITYKDNSGQWTTHGWRKPI